MASQIIKLFLHFKSFYAKFAEVLVTDFHARCFAHNVNVSIKEALSLIQTNIAAVCNLFFACRCSVKRQDRFEAIKKATGHQSYPRHHLVSRGDEFRPS